MRNKLLSLTVAVSLVSGLSLLTVSHSQGQTFNWTNTQNDNDFANLLNWSDSPGGFTGSDATWQIDLVGADRAEVASATGDVQRDVFLGVNSFGKGELFIGSSGSMTVTRDLSVGDAGGEGTLLIDGGTLNVIRNLRLGRAGGTDGFGTVTIDGGATVAVSSNLFIGQSNRAQNVFTLNDGTVAVTSTLNVAHQANTQGNLIISDGTLTAGNGVFADGGGGPSTATLSISGNGALSTTTGNLTFADKNGGATAIISLADNAELSSSTNVRIGFGNDSSATLNLSGGTINALDSFITFGQGDNTQVTVDMTGGTINADRTAWANSATASTTLNMTNGLINMVASVGSTAGTRGSLRLGEGDSQLNLSGVAVVVAERLLINAGGTIDLGGNALLNLTGSTIESDSSPGVLASPTFEFSQQSVSGKWSEVLGVVNFSSLDSVLRVVGESETILEPEPIDPENPQTIQIDFVDLFDAAIANNIFTTDVPDTEIVTEFDGIYTIVRLSAAVTTVVDQFVFHAGYTGAGSNVDTGKRLATEGQGPTALAYENLINTARGVDGVGLDIQDLADPFSLSAADFEFQVSPSGAFEEAANPPSGWAPAQAPSSVSVTPGSPSRVLIEWPAHSIENRWLRITLKANESTGLVEPKTFYVGHLLGETTGLAGSTYTVAFADISPIRQSAGQTVDASSIVDIDKNGTVSFADISAMRSNVGSQLTNITIP
jgi:hypothetical protein